MDSQTRELRITQLRIALLLEAAEASIRICRMQRSQLAIMLAGAALLRRETNKLRKSCQARMRKPIRPGTQL